MDDPMDLDTTGSSSDENSMDFDLPSNSTEDAKSLPEEKTDTQDATPLSDMEKLGMGVDPRFRVNGRQHMSFVGMVSKDKRVVLGVTVSGMFAQRLRKNPKKLSSNKDLKEFMKLDTGVLEVLGADCAITTLKERFPGRKQMILLDRRLQVNSEVFDISNPRRLGHIINVETSADLYLQEQDKIVADVTVTDENYVVSFNSNYWRQSPIVVVDRKRGRVIDFHYSIILKNDKGQRLKLGLNLQSSMRLRKTTDHRQAPSPITVGDRVKFLSMSQQNSFHDALLTEWLGEEGTLSPDSEWVIEEMELTKVLIRWEAHRRPTQRGSCSYSSPFSMFEDTAASNTAVDILKQELAEQKKDLMDQALDFGKIVKPTMSAGPTSMVEELQKKLEAVEAAIQDAQAQMEQLPATSSSSGFSVDGGTSETGLTGLKKLKKSASCGDLADLPEKDDLESLHGLKLLSYAGTDVASKFSEFYPSYFSDSPLSKRRRPYEAEVVEWLDMSQLQPGSLIPGRRDVVLNTKLRLSGTHDLLSREAYYNTLVPRYEAILKTSLTRIPATESHRTVVFEKPVMGQVINRRTLVTVQWFDGQIQQNMSPVELELAFRKNLHPTDIRVYRNMMLARNRQPKFVKTDRKRCVTEDNNEFGLVTKISEEKMLTVRWFKRDDKNSPFALEGEEVISQYEHVKHSMFRVPLRAYVYFPGNRDPDNIYQCTAQVVSMNDDGTQTVRYLDGSTAQFWPDEACPLDNDSLFEFDGFVEYGSYDGFDDDYPVDSWDSDVDDPMDPLSDSETPSYSSNSIYPVGYPSSDSFDIFSDFPSSTFSLLSGGVHALLPASTPDPAVTLIGASKTAGPSSPPKFTAKKTSVRFRLRGALGDMESTFLQFLRSSGIEPTSPEGITAFAAVFANIEPENRGLPWDKTRVAAHLAFRNPLEKSPDIKDARRMIKLKFKKCREEHLQQELEELIEKRPELNASIDKLFDPKEGAVAEVVEVVGSMLKSLEKFQYVPSRMRQKTSDEVEGAIVVVFPIKPTKKNKDTLDKLMTTSNPMRPSSLTRMRNLFSYLCPAEHCPLPIPAGSAAYMSHSTSLVAATWSEDVISRNCESDIEKVDDIPVRCGSLREMKRLEVLKTNYNLLVSGEWETSGTPRETKANNDDFESIFSLVNRGDNAHSDHHSHIFYYSKAEKPDCQDNLQREQMDKMELGQEALASKLAFDHGHPFAFCKDMPFSAIENLYCSGDVCPDMPVPHAIVLQVSSSLHASMPMDSFIAFQVVLSTVDSPTWPECTIRIHEDCGNNGTLASNFVSALLTLRQTGKFLNGPYFNICEVKHMIDILRKECAEGEGPFIEDYGLDTVKQIRNILLKMSSLACVKFWTKINLVEKHFGVARIVEAVKGIMSGGVTTVIPLKDLTKATEACTDTQLKSELTAIQLSHAPTTSPVPMSQGTFRTLDAVSSHSYNTMPPREMRRDFVATIKKEHKLLRENVPEGVHVVSFADRLDLLRAIIVGPVDTPYAGVPFLFDIFLGPTYPQEPPKVKYVSLTSQAINPNLYTEGTVCLSLLGTWKGENITMRWIPGTSNILQVVCSIQVEILMEANPYFNEPGYETRRKTDEGMRASRHYNAQVCVGSNEYFAEIMKEPPVEFTDFLREHSQTIPSYITTWAAWMEGREDPPFPVDITESVRSVVRRYHERLQKTVEELPVEGSKTPENQLNNLADIFQVDTTSTLTMFSSGNPGADFTDLNSFVLLRQV